MLGAHAWGSCLGLMLGAHAWGSCLGAGIGLPPVRIDERPGRTIARSDAVKLLTAASSSATLSRTEARRRWTTRPSVRSRRTCSWLPGRSASWSRRPCSPLRFRNRPRRGRGEQRASMHRFATRQTPSCWPNVFGNDDGCAASRLGASLIVIDERTRPDDCVTRIVHRGLGYTGTQSSAHVDSSLSRRHGGSRSRAAMQASSAVSLSALLALSVSASADWKSLVGKRPPHLQVQWINPGEGETLEDYHGKAVLLEFWAPW